MKRILPIVIIGFFIISTFGAVAQNNDIEKFDFVIIEHENIGGSEYAYSHTIFAEFGTATWCGYCKYAHAALKNIYAGGWHPFYYTSLVDDKNVHAAQRNDEYGLSGFPTVYFDGGYSSVVGAGSVESAQAAYNSSIVSCGNRNVDDIDISLDIEWQGPGNPSPEDGDNNAPIDECLIWTDAEMKISVSIDNNEGSSYNCNLRVYVTEVVSSMGWYDSGGYLYTFPFLDYAFNEDISIYAYQTWDDDTYWDGKDHNNGYGDDFSGITQDNTMVIAAVFNEDNNYYVDETAGLLAGVETDPKTYDVYFGDSNPPPKVSSNQSDLEYCPSSGLDFSTTYYWQIVAWDDQGSSIIGPLWSFTTRGNDPPNTPSNPDPADGATDVPIDTCISWTSEDPDSDEVTYDVYFGTSTPPPLVSSKQSNNKYCPGESLEYDTEYYWKIVAWDEFEYSSIGPEWTFKTEKNLPPNTPSDPDPADGATDVSIEKILKWTGGDPNSGDKVTYDVYFGKSNPPQLADEDLSQTAYDPGTMDLATTYYWQIVAEDNQGLITNGPMWHFTTEEELNQPPTAPDIDGPSEGSSGVELCWTFNSDDPNGDQVKYIIKWGDGTIEETDYYPDNTPLEVCHTYQKGDYIIEASSEDYKGLASGKTTFKVKITTPRFRTAYNPLLLRLFEHFSKMFLIFRQLLGLI